jgi:hypothetical protein
VDIHVQSKWANKLLFPPFVKDKRGESAMMSCLAALIKQVAKLREARLKACHCLKEFTLWRIRPLDGEEKPTLECPRLADPNHKPVDGKIFTPQVLPVTICYSGLIHSFFYLALTKAEIDRLVGHLFDKDPPIPQPNTVHMPYCTKNPPP